MAIVDNRCREFGTTLEERVPYQLYLGASGPDTACRFDSHRLLTDNPSGLSGNVYILEALIEQDCRNQYTRPNETMARNRNRPPAGSAASHLAGLTVHCKVDSVSDREGDRFTAPMDLAPTSPMSLRCKKQG